MKNIPEIVARLRDWKGIRMTPESMAHFISSAQEAADLIEQLYEHAEGILSAPTTSDVFRRIDAYRAWRNA